MRKSKFEIFIVSHVIKIRKFLFFLRTKNFLITVYIIFFRDREFKNLYFSCKLKSAVSLFLWVEFWKYYFFPQKSILKFSPFFRDSIFAANNTYKYYFNIIFIDANIIYHHANTLRWRGTGLLICLLFRFNMSGPFSFTLCYHEALVPVVYCISMAVCKINANIW